ncbi:LysR family transcriptional regulator [Bordetella sp. 2513F-2]
MTLDLRDLRNFLAVATAGSISRAAAMQHMAQPALSVHIKHIEDMLGTPLFERLPKGVRLTDAGERLLVHAKDILRRAELAYEEVSQHIRVPSGHVAIGLPQSMARFLTVPLVAAVLARWPGIRFQIIELSSGYIPGYLAKGDIDIGMTFGADDHNGLHYTHLLDEELVFISSPAQLRHALDSKAARRQSIALEELAAFRMILPTRTHSLRSRLDDYLARAGVQLDIVAEVNTTPQLIGLAASDIGSTILSYAAVVDDPSASGVRVLRFPGSRLTRPVFLCTKPSSPKTMAVTAVTQLIADTVSQLTEEGTWPVRMLRGPARNA